MPHLLLHLCRQTSLVTLSTVAFDGSHGPESADQSEQAFSRSQVPPVLCSVGDNLAFVTATEVSAFDTLSVTLPQDIIGAARDMNPVPAYAQTEVHIVDPGNSMTTTARRRVLGPSRSSVEGYFVVAGMNAAGELGLGDTVQRRQPCSQAAHGPVNQVGLCTVTCGLWLNSDLAPLMAGCVRQSIHLRSASRLRLCLRLQRSRTAWPCSGEAKHLHDTAHACGHRSCLLLVRRVFGVFALRSGVVVVTWVVLNS